MLKTMPFLLGATLMASCSFKSKDNSGGGDMGGGLEPQGQAPVFIDPMGDEDGDLILNGQEKEMGSNPLVANVPQLNLHFMQNFVLTTGIDGGGVAFKVSKQLESGDFDFKYRVGRPLIHSKSEKEIARVAGFSSAFQGEMSPFDLSLVEYPRIERTRYLTDLVSFQNKDLKLELDAKEVTMSFENSIELTPHHQFKEIRNVELGFWYFNRSIDQYELLATSVVERVFLAGVKESFSIELTGLPNRLLVENYLRHGELILTEVRDFEIPELKTSYKALMATVTAKTLPVVVNDPLQTKINYVALPADKKTLGSILDSLFKGDATVQENHLVRVGPYENSSPDYKELKELRGLKKSGRWFIFTNEFKHDLWQHPFEVNDRLVLTYAQDHIIAERPREILTNSFRSVSAQEGARTLPLGNVSSNSSLRLLVKGVREFGQKIDQFDDIFQSGGCGGGNSVCRDFRCHYDRRHLNDFTRPLTYALEPDLLNQYARLRLNQESIALGDLIKREGVTADIRGEDLVIVIDDLEKFFEQAAYGPEDILSLDIVARNFSDYRGIKFISGSGRDGHYMCGQQFIKPEMQPVDVNYSKFAEFHVGVSLEHYFN